MLWRGWNRLMSAYRIFCPRLVPRDTVGDKYTFSPDTRAVEGRLSDLRPGRAIGSVVTKCDSDVPPVWGRTFLISVV